MAADRYRRKPVEVAAVRYPGPDNFYAEPGGSFRRSSVVEAFIGQGYRIDDDDTLWFYVKKADADCSIRPRDWIIAEPDSDGFYPCTAENFAATYEPVGEGNDGG